MSDPATTNQAAETTSAPNVAEAPTAPEMPPAIQIAPEKPRAGKAPARQEDDDALWGSLGLPFFYRHTPPRAVARAVFWLAVVGIGALVVINVLMMPYARETLIYSIRDALFGHVVPYISFDEGGVAIFNQCFVIAIILSNIIAPLFATYSLSERVLGTMEFLRLSPMPTLSIVLGKMFAPAYVVHLISAVLLLFGSVIGVCAGLSISSVATALLVIVMSSALMHALGAFMAAYTLVFRGFGAVMGALGLGFFISVFPYTAGDPPQMGFLAYASPWGAMNHLFWLEHLPYRYWGMRPTTYSAEFMGSTGWLLPYIVALYAFVFFILVRGACRKLDKPEGSALPPMLWILVWAFAALTALGAIPNNPAMSMQRYARDIGFEIGAAIIGIAGLIISVLALLDHPYHRETALAEECSRAAGKSEQRGWRLPMQHAFFVAALTAASAAVLVGLLWYILPFNEFRWSRMIGLASLPVILAFLYGVVFETTAMGYQSAVGRLFIAYGVMLVFFFAMLIPAVQAGSAHEAWMRTTDEAVNYYTYRGAPPATAGTRRAYYVGELDWQRLKSNPERSIYLDGLDSKEAAMERREEYLNEPLALFLRYHPLAASIYVAVFVSLSALLFLWRKRVYAGLRREAAAAVRGSAPSREVSGEARKIVETRPAG